ncbi:hypothetical protein ZIOFF_036120 [Zingiber officinale]|uniref:Auxin efflux carrier component n=1 Tax=Zingiber officinale TaxID=94328 RepID=A0A8J5GAZ4_ZINOF|nr:hypothetical protein ZIOFF_036120 [Zingiber officinale]
MIAGGETQSTVSEEEAIMIRWGDVYKVVEAMAPLYVALGLGYASVRRWRFFTADQCEAVHRLVVYFVVPFFSFRFTAGIDPFALRVSVLAADALTKLLMAALLAAWHRWGSCSAGWVLTVFSLAQLTNTLVVGAPMLEAMYGRWAQDVVVQISVAQGVVYFPAVLFMLEMIKARPGGGEGKGCEAEGGGGSEEGNEDGGRCRWSPISVSSMFPSAQKNIATDHDDKALIAGGETQSTVSDEEAAMIRWGDVYKVVEAMAPLYVALGLGYASVRRWRFFTADQCEAVHRLVVYFVVPFFSFRFTAGIDPFALRVSVLAADALTKLLMAALLAAWHRWGSCSAG